MAKVETETRDDICVIKFTGKLTIGEGDVAIRYEVNEALHNGFKKIVLDLRDARFIDSSGLGELVRANQTVKNNGGKLVLVGVQGKVQEVLEMTRLIEVFEEYDSSDDAIMEIGNL